MHLIAKDPHFHGDDNAFFYFGNTLFRVGKEAPLRVNPEQTPGFRPGSRRIDLNNTTCYTAHMTVLGIVKYPSGILKKVAEPIVEVTGEITKLLDDMAETMYAAPGVGLAAPQVGRNLRCIVVDTGIKEEDETVKPNLVQLVNPEVVASEGEIEWEEGCLSIPEFTLTMKRPARIHVKALDKRGNPAEFDAEGLFAVAIQHEIDHLDGKLIIDNISQLRREMYLKDQKRKKLKDKDKEPIYL